MNSYYHAKISAKKHGGAPEDYQALHDFLDSSKACLGDVRHRALLHSTFGIFIAEQVFGTTLGSTGVPHPPPRRYSKAETYAVDWKARNSDLLELGLEKLEAIVAAQEAGRELQSTVASIPDDVFRDLFGDHVKVTIDRNGVTTDSYDHD